MTSYLLYALAQLGYNVDIMKYGINVVMDVINLSVDISERGGKSVDEIIDLGESAVDFEEG